MEDGPHIYSVIESEDDLRKFEALIRDLRRVYSGRAPTEADLENAPVLNAWNPCEMSVSCLEGIVSGHPSLGNKVIHTSQLYVVNVSERWARTYSRWYRLGGSMDQFRASILGSRKS